MKRKLVLAAVLIALGVLVVSYFAWNLNLSGSPAPPESSDWQLTIEGSVQHPLNLTLNEILAMPKSTVDAVLYCVDSPNVPVVQGNWTGVRLGFLLDKAEVSSGAVKVAFYAEDGFSTDLTVTAAMGENIILAYERDGAPLQEGLRLVVPGRWGYKWISGVNHIALLDFDFKGFWESRGYSDEAQIP
jgi:DMSO/TMAO reductase YedYZ molybdopterin-dependent catalytic subunit